jgi:hypothetical protein
MKRALALTFAALLFGVAGLAQISGSWSGTLTLLPSIDLSTELSLTYEVAGFTITGIFDFTPSFTGAEFSLSGALGPVELSGVMGFDPTVPAYAYTDLSSSMDFAGVSLSGGIFHGVYPYGVDYFEKTYYPLKWTDLHDQTQCGTLQTGSVLMLYTLEAAVDPVSLRVRFSDCCDGIEFYDFLLELEDISLCCGIAYDFDLYFTKAGFEYVLISIDPLFELCCGISVGVTVKFEVDSKTVSPSFSWGGIEGCVTVWGDLQKKEGEVGIEGWELYGYKIYCELAECYDLEIVTAFNVDAVEAIIGNVFEDDEFEYIKFGACGPACCGGTWELDATIFFGGGTLFDITRFVVDASVPIMDALTVGFSWESPDSFSVNWTFTF